MCCASSFSPAAVAAPGRPGPGVRVRPRAQQPQPHQGVPRLHRRQGISARHSTGVRKHTQEVRGKGAGGDPDFLKKYFGPLNPLQPKVVFVKYQKNIFPSSYVFFSKKSSSPKVRPACKCSPFLKKCFKGNHLIYLLQGRFRGCPRYRPDRRLCGRPQQGDVKVQGDEGRFHQGK